MNYAICIIGTLFFLIFVSCAEDGEETKGLTIFSGIITGALFGLYIGLTKSWELGAPLIVLLLYVAKYFNPDNVKYVQSRDKS